MTKSHGDQTFKRAFSEVAQKKGVPVNSDKANEIAGQIHEKELENMDWDEKDALWKDYRKLVQRMEEWWSYYA